MDTRLSRRGFLRQTGVLAPLCVLPRTRLSAADSATPRRLRIGLLGGSHSHALAKARILGAATDYELVGICEEDLQVQKAFEGLGVRRLSQAELFDQAEIVAVESNNKDHAGHARTVLRAGKHLHLEKPPTDTLAAFRELQELARDKERLMQMGYMWRYHPGINACLEAARQGWLGEVYQVRGNIDTTASPESRNLWAQFRAGVFFELGCHLVDPLIRLLGRPETIQASFQRLGPDPLADNTAVTFQFKRAVGIITSAALQPRAPAHRTFEVLGTNGRAAVKPIEPPALEIDLHKPAGPYAAGKQTVPMPRYERYAPEFTDLARVLREGRSWPFPPAEDLLVHESFLRACDLA